MDSNLIFYGVASIFYLFVGLKIVVMSKKNDVGLPIGVLVIAVLGVVNHFWVLQSDIFIAPGTIQLGWGSALSAICFFSTLILLFGAIYSRADTLFGIILLISALGVWLPEWLSNGNNILLQASSALKIHIAVAWLADSFVLMSVVQAIHMFFLERQLQKQKPSLVKAAKIESISVTKLPMMGQIHYQIVVATFISLILMLLTGILLWSKSSIVTGDLSHQMILSGFSCGLLAIWLCGRKFLNLSMQCLRALFWLAVCFQIASFCINKIC